jgi:hypothetical protein
MTPRARRREVGAAWGERRESAEVAPPLVRPSVLGYPYLYHVFLPRFFCAVSYGAAFGWFEGGGQMGYLDLLELIDRGSYKFRTVLSLPF